MDWVLRLPQRFIAEKKTIDELGLESPWLLGVVWRLDVSTDLAVKVEFDMNVHGKSFEGVLTYPEYFPNTPPIVQPRNAEELWTRHQYGKGGALCLQWRADNWHSEVTGADMIRSAYELLASENDPVLPVVVESAHRLTLGQSTRSASNRLVLTASAMAHIAGVPIGECRVLKLQAVEHYADLSLFVLALDPDLEQKKLVDDLPTGTRPYFPLYSLTTHGRLFRSAVFDALRAPSDFEDLLAALRTAGFADEQIPKAPTNSDHWERESVLLVGTELREARAYLLGKDGKSLKQCEVFLAAEKNQRIFPEGLALQTKRVGIVGAGSLGSKVAVSLARAGVRRFLLIDDDVLMPENLVRHELNWSGIGLHKVDALTEALLLVAPAVEVEVRRHRIAGQESATSAASALKDLGACDLLVDATANSDVWLKISAIALASKKAMVWGELFAGGIGGLVARASPTKDALPLGVRAAIQSELNKYPEAPNKQAPRYDGTDDEPLTAYDHEVAAISAALTNLAVDTMLDRTPSEFPASAHILGLRKAWIFEQIFDTRPIQTVHSEWTQPESTLAEKEASLALLLKMLPTKKSDADSSAAP